MSHPDPSGHAPGHAPGQAPGPASGPEPAGPGAWPVTGTGRLHHTELWVRDIAASRNTVGWLLGELGYLPGENWGCGTSYMGAHDYIVLESGPDVLPVAHQRRAPGLNHLAFVAGTRQAVDALAVQAVERGFTLLFADAHPFAGGPQHYAAYLEDPDGFEFELVADA